MTSITVSSLVTKKVMTKKCKCDNGVEVLTNTETVVYLLSTAWMKSLNSLKGVPGPHIPSRDI